jgi:hypothetical protein
MNEISRERLLSYNNYLTVGALKEFITRNNISDDALIVVQRIEDDYYEGIDISGMRGPDGVYPEGSKTEGWGVYLKEGGAYHHAKRHNDDIDSGKYEDKEQYPDLDTSKLKKYTEEELRELKDQYHPVWSPVRYNDEGNDILFLDLHY